ncbi:hypothetical protein BD410DRAFT_895548 [Rickenella mellea]|uniref:Uncharacterized protein n=1 Tax=Rickenella mellea TaxID=50990 RepID=A0A4Y7QFU5_9AGAM|nr:hypothetical protein BD410DRAFT_895548 [Rickenella mellea]
MLDFLARAASTVLSSSTVVPDHLKNSGEETTVIVEDKGGVLDDKTDAHTPAPQSRLSEKFTTPDHPSLKYLESLKVVPTTTPPPPYEGRDPHLKPSFSSDDLTEPILYLPPLISSLPPTVPGIVIPTRNPPMVTETRLPDIDPVSLSLHKALHYFRPYNSKYASLPYATAFNWSELTLPINEEREWYCVAFRSKRKVGSDGTPLYDADKKAHEEAVQNGGLLLYWYGVPDPETGLNLATCIWQSRSHAIAANSRPHHIRAMRLAKDSYEVYTLERHTLRKVPGQAHVTIEPYESGESGW